MSDANLTGHGHLTAAGSVGTSDSAEMLFKVTRTADGEVRDAEGNLLSSAPYEATEIVTATQLAEMGLEAPQKEQ